MAAPRRSAFPRRAASRSRSSRPGRRRDPPCRARATAPPTPSSAIVIRSTPFVRAVSTTTREGDPCLTALVSASQATKYAVASTSGGARSGVAVTSTGIAAPRARSASAAARPSSSRGGRTPGGDRAQVGDRGRDLGDGGVERRDEHLRLARERALQAPEHDAERDQPLLRAVVEVALEPSAFLVAGLGDPRAGGLHLGQLQPQLDAQAGELDRHGGGAEHALQEIGGGGCVQEHAEVAPDHGARAPVVGQLDRTPVAVRVGPGLGELEDERGVPVVERDRDHGADVLRLRVAVADLVEELAQHPHRVEPPPREAAIDQRLQPVAQREEDERGGDRRQRGRQLRSAHDLADQQRHERVGRHQQPGQRGVDQRAVDEPVDRVQPVAADRHRHRGRRPRLQQRQQSRRRRSPSGSRSATAASCRRARPGSAARRTRATAPAGAAGSSPAL